MVLGMADHCPIEIQQGCLSILSAHIAQPPIDQAQRKEIEMILDLIKWILSHDLALACPTTLSRDTLRTVLELSLTQMIGALRHPRRLRGLDRTPTQL